MLAVVWSRCGVEVVGQGEERYFVPGGDFTVWKTAMHPRNSGPFPTVISLAVCACLFTPRCTSPHPYMHINQVQDPVMILFLPDTRYGVGRCLLIVEWSVVVWCVIQQSNVPGVCRERGKDCHLSVWRLHTVGLLFYIAVALLGAHEPIYACVWVVYWLVICKTWARNGIETGLYAEAWISRHVKLMSSILELVDWLYRESSNQVSCF